MYEAWQQRSVRFSGLPGSILQISTSSITALTQSLEAWEGLEGAEGGNGGAFYGAAVWCVRMRTVMLLYSASHIIDIDEQE